MPLRDLELLDCEEAGWLLVAERQSLSRAQLNADGYVGHHVVLLEEIGTERIVVVNARGRIDVAELRTIDVVLISPVESYHLVERPYLIFGSGAGGPDLSTYCRFRARPLRAIHADGPEGGRHQDTNVVRNLISVFRDTTKWKRSLLLVGLERCPSESSGEMTAASTSGLGPRPFLSQYIQQSGVTVKGTVAHILETMWYSSHYLTMFQKDHR